MGGGGTEAKVQVRLYTSEEKTGWSTLLTNGGFWSDTDRCFHVQAGLDKGRIGQAKYIDVKIDDSGISPPWFIETVRVGTNGHTFVSGTVGRWVEKDTPVLKLALN